MTPMISQRLTIGVSLILGLMGARWYSGNSRTHGSADAFIPCLTCVPGVAVSWESMEAVLSGYGGKREVPVAGAGKLENRLGGEPPHRAGLPVPAALLPPRHSEQWPLVEMGPVFAAFREWTERWRDSGMTGSSTVSAALEQEGVRLAQIRRRALADLIQGDTTQALKVAVPARLKAGLPGTVAAWLESWVNVRADYSVACAYGLPGQDESPTTLVRWAEWDGVRTRVFTTGDALSWVTKKQVPLQGIVLPVEAGTNPLDQSIIKTTRLMALADSPARLVEPGELPAGSPREAVGLEIGGEFCVYENEVAARAAVAARIAAIDFTRPDQGSISSVGVAPLPGDAAGSAAAPSDAPTAASARTEGYKRLLFLRVDFPDSPGEQATIPLAEAEALLRDLRAYTQLMSFGRHAIAPVGTNGSAITPVMRMSSNSSFYDNEGLSLLYPEARSKATAAGFDLSRFDYDGVFTQSRPDASYAGLAYVGGRGFHMANGYFAKHVTTHEYGHNLGLPHAHFWETEDESIIGPGTVVEYGNNYDPMGDAYATIPGEKHYNGGYKNYLDWIPDADVGLVTTSGQYRLAASDFQQSRGRRAMRLRKDSRDYWLEFRPGLTDSLLSHSVFLEWGNSDGRENYLLDALPGVSGTSLAIGRTFSDPRANNGVGVHVTPVRTGGTFPESIDLQVTIGTPVGNQPPFATVTANTSAAPANTPVAFSAIASDPNNDALAYAWDFGDGDFSIDNQPVQTHRFDASGEYAVQCTVSDMRGGTTRATVIVKVEAPTVFRITGKVVDPDQQPVAGIQITAASGSERRLATTDSSGAYALTGLGARAWTLTARETVADTLNFTQPFNSSTITVGPSASGIDFVASSGPQETVTPLIAKRSVWKWFAEGIDPLLDWEQPGFDDSGWEEGAGVLGYGNESGQATTLPFGPSSTTKWTGSFFRRTFTLADPAQFPTLRLEVLRDDGIVIYLNGQEVFRDNLPPGPVSYATQANDATEPNDYIVRNIDVATALPDGLLVTGTNFITTSVHQATSTSSDLAFDLALSGVAPLEGVGNSVVYLTAPGEGAVVPSTAPSVALQASVQVKSDSIEKVEFFGDGGLLGEDNEAPYAFDWPTPAPGAHSAHVVATWASGGSATSALVTFAVHPPAATLVAADAVWKYSALSAPAPAGWQSAGFDDSNWSAGLAQLGFGEADEATVIPSGTSTSRPLTSYFRHTFIVQDPQAVTELVARLIRDDGALVWLNGVEVIRTNLPATGVIGYGTLATGAGPNAIDNSEYTFALNPGNLVAGPNVIAVEVHQSDATSSDLSFQLALEARTTTPRPRGLTLSGPAAATAPQSVALVAEGVAGGALGLARIEFLADGVVIGEDLTAPFSFSWTSPPVGTSTITAVATDTAGATLASAPLALTVAAPPTGVALVSFGESWRYLDEGTAPAATWKNVSGFDDAGWAQGQARLGYGGDAEATLIGYGALPSSRYITTWFRKRFSVADPSAFTELMLRLVRDDGAVVYLNGTEILRSNLPAGAITPTTLASTDVSSNAEREAIDALAAASLLVAGENVLAVELHQASASSIDLGMDVELLGLGTSEGTFRFTSPVGSQSISAEVDLPLTVWAAPEIGVTRVEYFAGPAFIGSSQSAPYFSVPWTTPLLGTYVLTARATLTGGGTLTAGPLTLSVDEPRASATHVTAGSAWRFWDAGTLPAANWTAAEYTDAGWRSGPARLGFGADGEATAILSGRIAYYFRKSFTVASLADIEEVALRFQRDDGVVIYLNGVEVARDNMPAGLVDPTTTATADITNEQLWSRLALPPSVLRIGTNILAAEVHQRALTSSDLGWDAELTSRGVNLLAVANTAPVTAPWPAFSALAGPGGVADGWELRFPESNGRLYVIEESDDMITWIAQSYEFARDGQIAVRLPPDPVAPNLFYRARWLPTLPE